MYDCHWHVMITRYAVLLLRQRKQRCPKKGLDEPTLFKPKRIFKFPLFLLLLSSPPDSCCQLITRFSNFSATKHDPLLSLPDHADRRNNNKSCSIGSFPQNHRQQHYTSKKRKIIFKTHRHPKKKKNSLLIIIGEKTKK